MPLKLSRTASSKPATSGRSYYISNPIPPKEPLASDPVAINSLGSGAPGRIYRSQGPFENSEKLPPSDSLHPKRRSQSYATASHRFPGPVSGFEEELPSTRKASSPEISPLNLSGDKTFDQSWQIDRGLSQQSNAGTLEDRAGVRRNKATSSVYSRVISGRGALDEDLLSTSKRGPYNTLPHIADSKTKENSARSELVDVPRESSALEEPRGMAGKSHEPVASNFKRNLKLYCALCLLTILILVVAVVVLAVLGSAKISSLENELKGTMTSETLTSSSALPSTESSALGRATSIEPQSGSKPTGVTLVTPVSETSDTPIRSPTPTSALEPSLIRQPISSISSSLPISPFLQTTDIDENLIRRSGYIDQDEDVLPNGVLARDSHLDPREDLEDCEDVTTTITTTLTTTVTSILRTSKPVVSGARSNSVSPQLPEPEPTEASSESVTDTIVHTAGLSTSIISQEIDLLDTISSSVTADSTLSPGMTPSPTTPPATEPLREGAAVISASSSAIARRLVAPLACKNLRHLRRFLPLVNEYDNETQRNRHVLPSPTVNPTATTTNHDKSESSDTTAQPITTASSSAAVARQALNWIPKGKATSALPSKTHNRRQAPSQSPSLPDEEEEEGKWTPWQAYSQLRLQAEQMCFSVETYQDTTLTPEEYQTPEDLRLGEELDQIICNTLQETFPAVHQGGQCDTQSEWLSLESKIEEVCALSPAGDKLGIDVEQICNLRKWLVEKVDGCGGSLVGSSSSVPPTSSGKPTASTDAGSETLSSGTASSILSISLQQNAMASTNPGATVSPIGPDSMPSKMLLVTSTSILQSVSVPPSLTTSGIPSTSAIATPNAGIGVVPEHPSLTPPSDWTVSMLTYSTQAASYTSLRTMPSNAAGTPPAYTGPHLAKDWPNLYLFPIPTGYVVPNIVPANPQIGQLTYFNPGLGACGLPNMESNELAVTVSWELFDMGREIGGSSLEEGWRSDGVNPDGRLRNPIDQTSSALCNQGTRACLGSESGERLVEQEFVVRDRCEGCNVSDLDIQSDVYSEHWDALDKGRIQVTWEWMQEAPTDVPG